MVLVSQRHIYIYITHTYTSFQSVKHPKESKKYCLQLQAIFKKGLHWGTHFYQSNSNYRHYQMTPHYQTHLSSCCFSKCLTHLFPVSTTLYSIFPPHILHFLMQQEPKFPSSLHEIKFNLETWSLFVRFYVFFGVLVSNPLVELISKCLLIRVVLFL